MLVPRDQNQRLGFPAWRYFCCTNDYILYDKCSERKRERQVWNDSGMVSWKKCNFSGSLRERFGNKARKKYHLSTEKAEVDGQHGFTGWFQKVEEASKL